MLEKTFRPNEVEARLYAQWEESGAFRAGSKPGVAGFSIVIPPPNVTGSLHIGHALNNTLQDALARFERMRGKNVLWQPGTDHAGIATQLVVERELAKRQMSRVGLGREKFLDEVWRWKEDSGGTIVRQLRRLGASCDWSRERFTMDPGQMTQAVIKAFVELYNSKDENGKQLIYKDKRLVNWDPRLQTAVSDLEVENIEVKGKLWHIKYPIEGEDGRFIVVATTRPETMLGDVAVAVHPEDERYKALVGKYALLPLADRRIPIIADDCSDPEKGTGAVKITPAHDFNDFEVGKRHGLRLISVLDRSAKIDIEDNRAFWEETQYARNAGSVDALLQNIGGYSQDEDTVGEYIRYEVDDPKLDELRSLGKLDRFEARKRIVADLEAQGFIDRVEDIVHAVPHDEKTKTVVLEPFLTEQWYLNVTPLAEKAIHAVEERRTRFIPEHWSNVYFNWMRNIQPWCISRQLWWGHQIPAWYGPNDEIFVEETEAEAVAAAERHFGKPVEVVPRSEFFTKVFLGSTMGEPPQFVGKIVPISRDDDVLDTWFSSALWPFSTMGWPDETPELKLYYPTSVLVTGFDIIFFWVARMMMMGLHFMGDVPFHDVFIHTRVLDEKGQKMSKTKGNVVDPLDIIGEYGADALRFALAIAAGQGRDIRLGLNRVETCRNFGTKLWNAARFCEMNECVRKREFDPAGVEMIVNQWIVAETARSCAEVTAALEAYRFNEAAGAVYRFVWDVFCDWYVEFIKPMLNGNDETAKAETRDTAAWVLDRILQLLHPFMPFITEELWARIAEHAEPRRSMLMLSPWPDLSALPKNEAARAEMNWLIELVSGVRSVRSEMNVPPSARIALLLKGADAQTLARLARNRDVALTLARLSSMRTASDIPQGSAQFVIGEAVAALPLGDVIDIGKERARLAKDLKKCEDEIAKFDAKLGNAAFVAKAPEEVIEEQKERRAESAAIAARLHEALKRLSG